MNNDEPDLKPCPHCEADCAEVLAVEIDMYAAVCRACGAHGPVRVLGPKQLVKFVQQQAADDWNRRPGDQEQKERSHSIAELLEKIELKFENSVPPVPVAYSVIEYPEGPPAASAPTDGEARDKAPGEAVSTAAPGTSQPREEPPAGPQDVDLDAVRAKGRSNGEQRRRVDQPVSVCPTKSLATTPAPSTLQPVTAQGLERRNAPSGGDALQLGPVRLRLRDWLDQNKTSIDTAVVHDGVDLGTSHSTLYKLMNGFATAKTLEKVSAALDKLEAENRAAAPVEKLPNKYAPIIGLNRTETPTAPARCARTP